MHRRHCLALFVAIFLATPAVHAQVIVVDTFDIPADSVSGGSGAFDVTVVPGGNRTNDTGGSILGERDLSFTGTINDDNSTNRYTIGDGGPSNSRLSTSFNDESSIEVTLNYDNFGTLNLSTMVAIEFDFSKVDAGIGSTDIEVTVTLTTTSGTLQATTNFAESLVDVTYSVPVGLFSGPGDLSQVTGIEISFNDGGTPNLAADFTLHEIRITTPEPASLALWGLIGTGGAFWCRRRRAARVA